MLGRVVVEATVRIGGPTLRLGFGAGAGVVSATTGAGAGGAACPNVGWKLQSWTRWRVTRGTQFTTPATPARTKAQPSLSTNWLPVKDAGGFSAGYPLLYASAVCTESPTISADALIILRYAMRTPTRYCGKMPNNPNFVKGLFESQPSLCPYLVPNMRSPASPSPGTIYPWSLRWLSTAAVTIGTSG